MREYEYEDEELEEEFEIYTGERKSVKAVNAPEEQLPDEYQKRKKFLTDLSRLEPPNAFYPPFLQALKDLNQEIRVLTTPNKDGWPILDRERKATLMRLYMETAERLQEFLKQKRSKRKDDEIITNEINTNRIITNEIKEDEIITNRISTHEIKEDEINIDQNPEEKAQRLLDAQKICGELESLIANDYRALQNYDPDSGKTFLSVLEDARTTVYEYPTHEAIRKIGGGMNTRFKLQMEGPDGKMIPGYFTEKDSYDCIPALDKLLRQASKKAATPDGTLMIKGFVEQYMVHYSNPRYADENHPTDRTNRETWRRLFKNIGGGKYNDTRKDKLVAEMAAVFGVRPADVTTYCGSAALDLMVNRITSIKDNFMVSGEVGIPMGARKDSRNSAMSTVAGLLGVPELVAYARPMVIHKEDGTMIEGTFMAEADGFDPNNPGNYVRFRINNAGRQRALTGSREEFFRKISELQALDFICGNGDRHAGNVFYQIDDSGIFHGIQGIDNDLSFGLNPKDFYSDIKEMVVPRHMGVISKEMANRILQLKPEHLEFALKDQLESNAIKAAVERLRYMQKRIMRSREVLPKDSTRIQFPYIRELSGEEWKTLDPDTLWQAENDNLFKKIWEDFPMICSRLHEREDLNKMTTIGTANRAEFTGISQTIRDAKQYEEQLSKAVGKQKYATADYQKLQTSLTAYREKAEKIYNRILKARKDYEKAKGSKDVEAVTSRYVSRADLADMTTAAAKVKAAAVTYYNNAEAEVQNRGSRPDDVARMQKMKDATRNIHDKISNLTKLREEEQKTLQKNQRRQTEDMLKQMKKKAPDKGPRRSL